MVYDQSFCRKTLERTLERRDFRGVPTASQKAYRDSLLAKAEISAATRFNAPAVPLTRFPLHGKLVYCLGKLEDELVARKLCKNLNRCISRASEGRSQIVSNLSLLLAEGVPYRVYRLDVRSFYESFPKVEVVQELSRLRQLSPQSKSLIETLLHAHTAMGGVGIPRGLSLSAALSDLMMRRFDWMIQTAEDSFYYARYVDDIVIVTSARESQDRFIRRIKTSLPSGLRLNPDKRQVVEAITKVTPAKSAPGPKLFSFDYLGYKFSVGEPVAPNKKAGELNRTVFVDIASRKVKKLKSRIVRSFLEFVRTSDWGLLQDRIAFLTQNFSVYNQKAGGKKLAGIYHSYPLVTEDAEALQELDRFLRHAILSKTGRVFSKSSALLSGNQRRKLLSQSFARGHSERSFVHFSAMRISEIQSCWLN